MTVLGDFVLDYISLATWAVSSEGEKKQALNVRLWQCVGESSVLLETNSLKGKVQ